jgi:hypothetical protein
LKGSHTQYLQCEVFSATAFSAPVFSAPVFSAAAFPVLAQGRRQMHSIAEPSLAEEAASLTGVASTKTYKQYNTTNRTNKTTYKQNNEH